VGQTTFAVLTTLFVVAAVPFAPTEALLIGASALAASGDVPLPAVLAVGALGCATSDVINYAIGRFFGPAMLAKLRKKRARNSVMDWVSDQLSTRPILILVAARFLPMGGIFAAVLCGATSFPLRRYLPISMLGSTAWTLYAATLGYVGTTLTSEPLAGMAIGLAAAAGLGAVGGLIGNHLPRRSKPVLAVDAA
jgi:membrane protein DedA with SNARE-associated domain